MDWLKQLYIRLKTAVYIKISSEAKRRAESNLTSVRSHFIGLEVGNFCIAVSTTGFMALGVIPMSLPLLLLLASMLFIVGLIGRYIDAVEDDVERLLKYEEHMGKSADGGNTHPSGTDSVQQQSD